MQLFVDISNYYNNRVHTGIQRVVREFLFRLIGASESNFNYLVIFFDTERQSFVHVLDDEVINFLNDSKQYVFKDISHLIHLEDFCVSDVFFDLDGVWNDGLKRSFLYPKLKNLKVNIVNFIYDLVPVVMPEYSHENTTRNFATFLYAVYQYSDLVFFDSRSAEQDFLVVKERIDNQRDIPTRVIPLGADISIEKQKRELIISENLIKLSEEKYLLFVGTIEPRKNQALLLDVFEQLLQDYPKLHMVLVGRAGWNNEALISRLNDHIELNKRLLWFNNLSDDELTFLYSNAFACIYLSSYEGFGLPIAESLNHHKVTITSKNSSMFEMGRNCADYLQYNSINELRDLISMYLSNPKLHHKKEHYIKSVYQPYLWDQTFSSILKIFNNLNREFTKNLCTQKLQFIFISIDFDKLQGTIKAIDRHMNFVEEYIVVTSRQLVIKMQELISKNNIRIINEDDILGFYAEGFSLRDHQSKNWLLRASLINLDSLAEQFIMLDDDNRPIKDISSDMFIKNGKYQAYFYYDLLSWNSLIRDYDQGQVATRDILTLDRFELLSYSSHRPQIINKEILKEVVNKYFDIGLKYPIDEWTIYFNYAISNYPRNFIKKTYDVLNWPGNYSDWSLQYWPQSYSFENFYPEKYNENKELAVAEKLSLNQKIKNIYLANKKMYSEDCEIINKYGLVHGILHFKDENTEVYVSNLPYFIRAISGTWVKLSLNVKMLDVESKKLEIVYWINGRLGHRNLIHLGKEDNSSLYSENFFDIGISCETLQLGVYDLIFDLIVDNKTILGTDSKYLVKLFVGKSPNDFSFLE